MQERIQKLIAQAGLASRRKAEDWIARGQVLVNDRVAELGDRADLEVDRVLVNGIALRPPEEQVAVMLNKPRGYLCSLRDPQGRRLVTELVSDLPQRLFPVGRLDYNTEGLLLLTNNGQLAQQLSHPRHHVEKTYLVKARGRLTEQARQQLSRGVMLKDGMTAPAKISKVRIREKTSWFELTIHEGRNRQVRRMCEAVGLSVSRLKRVRLGFLTLGELASGQYRLLTPAEVNRLKSL